MTLSTEAAIPCKGHTYKYKCSKGEMMIYWLHISEKFVRYVPGLIIPPALIISWQSLVSRTHAHQIQHLGKSNCFASFFKYKNAKMQKYKNYRQRLASHRIYHYIILVSMRRKSRIENLTLN